MKFLSDINISFASFPGKGQWPNLALLAFSMRLSNNMFCIEAPRKHLFCIDE